jgi:hypothetical protein
MIFIPIIRSATHFSVTNKQKQKPGLDPEGLAYRLLPLRLKGTCKDTKKSSYYSFIHFSAEKANSER